MDGVYSAATDYLDIHGRTEVSQALGPGPNHSEAVLITNQKSVESAKALLQA